MLSCHLTTEAFFDSIGSNPDHFIYFDELPPAAQSAASEISMPEMAVTDAIRQQAAALNNDPVNIFEFVRNAIAYELYYGCFKGAEGTLLSLRGNDLDQCALLGALLKAADPDLTPRYIRGDVILSEELLSNLHGFESLFTNSQIERNCMNLGDEITAGYNTHPQKNKKKALTE
jgi:hypothetical protein